MKKRLIILLASNLIHSEPQLTVIFVIDQFGARNIKKLNPFLHHGIRNFLDNGVVYTNAHHPNGVPITCAGHANLSTGTVPKVHGLITGEWYNENGNLIVCSQDNRPQSQILRPNEKRLKGKSAHSLKRPTINRTFLQSNKNNKAFILAICHHAATAMAGSDAPAIWFDQQTNSFSSSKAYFEKLPEWVDTFNQKHQLLNKKVFSWGPLAYNNPDYYQFPNIENYDYTMQPSLIKERIVKRMVRPGKFKNPFIYFPNANQTLLDLAETCIKQNKKQNLLIWIGLSSLDEIGHLYGPDSKETIDMIYHLDKQIGNFMNNISQIIPKQKTLYALTGDHGVMPLPELAQKYHPNARRIHDKPLFKQLNKKIEEQFGVKNLVQFNQTHIFCKPNLYNALEKETQHNILTFIVEKLEKVTGIKKVHINNELREKKCNEGSTEWLLQNSLFPDRDGQLTVEVEPYVLLDKRKDGGTSHVTPYDYDTHVPLILYHTNQKPKIINKKVWTPQFTATLAKLLKVEKPHQDMFPPLPQCG